MLRSAVALVAILAFVSSSTAQQQPYGGLQSRTVKALSPQQIDDLKSGRGMGLALAAELNGYPGPLHVLELATPLALTEAQRQKMQDLIAAMKADTIPLGERLIAHEQELDDLFAKKAVTPESLAAVTATIGSTQGALRAAHLRYHLYTLAELTPEQVQRYMQLRGYTAPAAPGPHQHRQH
jgi:hypothetical protein